MVVDIITIAEQNDIAAQVCSFLKWPAETFQLGSTCKVWSNRCKNEVNRRKQQHLTKFVSAKAVNQRMEYVYDKAAQVHKHVFREGKLEEWSEQFRNDHADTDEALVECVAHWAGGWVRYLERRNDPLQDQMHVVKTDELLHPWPCNHGDGSVLIMDIWHKGKLAHTILLPTTNCLYMGRSISTSKPLGDLIPQELHTSIQRILSTKKDWWAILDKRFLCSFDSVGSRQEDVKQFDLFVNVIDQSEQPETLVFGGLGSFAQRTPVLGECMFFEKSFSFEPYNEDLPNGTWVGSHGCFVAMFVFHWDVNNRFNVALLFNLQPVHKRSKEAWRKLKRKREDASGGPWELY